MSKEDYLKVRTFDVQWINHPEYGNSTLIVDEGLLFCEYTTDIRSFACADKLHYSEAMLHFIEGNMVVITRNRDLRIPLGEF